MKLRRLILLLTLPILACGLITSTPQPAPSAPPPTDLAPDSPSLTIPPAQALVPTAMPREEATRYPDPARYEWRQIVGGLERPVDIQNAGDGSGRLFVIEKAGQIRIIQNDNLAFQPFLDITDRVDDSGNEMGLLGLAFHPDFERNGFFYINYTRRGGDTIIARFSASGNAADPNSETILLNVKQPYPNHNGGGLAFGPDGYLYIGLGDGGAGGDPHGNGQNLNTLLGKLLRVNVDSGDPYGIPSDNPFGDEVWAYGLRNPWRFSFDKLTGDLWLGDVGQGDYEEVNFVPAGAPGGINFGWSLAEGMHPFEGNSLPENHWPPVFEYDHASTVSGCSVVGGYVYRGAMAEWQGIYFYGDYCTGVVWTALRSTQGADVTWTSEYLFQTGLFITSFGVDEAGELYIVSDSGTVHRLTTRQ